MGLILVLKGLTVKASKTADSIQLEMNHQFDRFQKQLVESQDALVDMQKRMILSDQVRDHLDTLYAESQNELTKTRGALERTNVALVHTQKALADIVQALKDGTVSSRQIDTDASTLANSDSTAPIADPDLYAGCTARLTRIKAAIAATKLAIATEGSEVREEWRISTALANELAKLDNKDDTRKRLPNQTDDSARGNDPSVTSPDLEIKTLVEPDERDKDGTGARSIAFVYDRIDERTQELLGLNAELSDIHAISAKLATNIVTQKQKLNTLKLDGLLPLKAAARN